MVALGQDHGAGSPRPDMPGLSQALYGRLPHQCGLAGEVRPEFYSDEINKMLALKKKLGGRLQSVLGLGVNVKLVEPRSIERSVGKAKRVIDNRKI